MLQCSCVINLLSNFWQAAFSSSPFITPFWRGSTSTGRGKLVARKLVAATWTRDNWTHVTIGRDENWTRENNYNM
jgi:hypothetical protein